MKLFFIQSSKENLIKFEDFRATISPRTNTFEIRNIIAEMLENLKDISRIQVLADKYSLHFNASVIRWSMEYEIAFKILETELSNNKLSYVYELTNYYFYYSLLPTGFKSTFFLMHGILLNNDQFNGELVNQIRNRKYVIYKKNQEINDTYLVYWNELGDKLGKAALEASGFYNTKIFGGEADDNSVYIFQINNVKK